MANVVEEIFKLNADTNDLITKLKQAKGVYSELTKEQEQQLIQLGLLEKKEKELITAREKSANPTSIIKYNAAIDATVKEIGALKEATDKLTASESKAATEANAVSKAVSNAFKGTTIAAANKEVEKISKSFDGTTESVGNTEKKAISLKAQLRELKIQIANATEPEDIERLSKAAGDVQDKLDDANESAGLFASGSKFEILNKQLSDIGGKILSFDFGGAAERSKLLLNTTKQINFKESLTGLKDLGTTFLNLGKAILTNPLFLIGGAIVLIIANFDKLKNAGGAVGSVFKFIGDIITGVKDGFFELTDAIGLTALAFEKLNQLKLDKLKEVLDDNVKTLDRFIKAQKALGKETEDIEKRKQEIIIESSAKQLEALRSVMSTKSEASEEDKKREQELVDAILDAENEKFVITQNALNARKEKAKKYAEDVSKIFEDLNKKIIDLSNKESEFNVKFKFQEGSQAQLEEVYKLREKIENQSQAELEKLALKNLKSQSDIEEAKIKLTTIANKTKQNRLNDYNEAVLSLTLSNGQKQIAFEKQVAESSLALTTQTESQKANISIQIQQDANDKTIALLQENIEKRKQLGLNTVELEKELGQLRLNQEVEFANASKELLSLNSAEANKQIDFEKQHANTLLSIKNKSNSTRLFSDIAYERERLSVMEQSFGQYSQEYKTQLDKINALEKEAKKQRVLEIVSYFETAINAAVSATNQILSAKQKEVEGQITLQQKRVDEAKAIADKGNSQVLELEQKRLDELNKKRANYVKQQQELAAVELVANTAIAVSKAAAEGGAAAGVTIAAALLALVAGLASARSVASQAAYYEGGLYPGEGFTGHGNPREESRKLGGKPYQYHKEEYIFNHVKTRKFRDIFEDVHAGKIDLNKWKEKVQAYDQLATHRMMVSSAPMQMLQPQIINSGADMKRLESQMSELIFIMQNKRFGNDLVWNERGVISRMNAIVSRENKIKNIAKA